MTRPIPAASSLDLNAYQGLDFAIVSPRVFALLERYNGFIPMASLSVDIPDSEPGAELRPVVSALVFATPDADEDGLAKPHLSDIAGETVTVVKGDEVDTTFLLQNELSSRRLAPVKVRVASDGGTPSEIIRRAVERGDKLFAVSTDLLRETSSDLFSGFVKVDMRVDDETGLVSSVTPMPGRVFAAGLSVARMGLLEFSATLFALDIAPDIRWVRPADYRSCIWRPRHAMIPPKGAITKKTFLERSERRARRLGDPRRGDPHRHDLALGRGRAARASPQRRTHGDGQAPAGLRAPVRGPRAHDSRLPDVEHRGP